jgi:hypothetical protein
MRRFTPSMLKDFLSGAILTGGFTLISVGVGMIAGSGAGLIVGGALAVAFQQWWTNSGG